MAFDRTTPEDAAALSARRVRLRALGQRICDAVEAMPLPESFHEGERAARSIALADRLLERLPGGRRSADGVVPPARQRLRVFADQVLSVIEDLPMPETYRDGERALRCVLAAEKLYDQFYAPPKMPRSRFDEFEPEDDDDSPETVGIRIFEKIDLLSLGYAHDCGFYPDGSPYERGTPEAPERLSCPEETRLMTQWISAAAAGPVSSEDGARQIAAILTARFNAVARAQARHAGTWPDGKAFQERDGDYFAVSKAYPATDPSGGWHRAPDEDEGPRGAPWWMVRNPDTS